MSEESMVHLEVVRAPNGNMITAAFCKLCNMIEIARSDDSEWVVDQIAYHFFDEHNIQVK